MSDEQKETGNASDKPKKKAPAAKSAKTEKSAKAEKPAAKAKAANDTPAPAAEAASPPAKAEAPAEKPVEKSEKPAAAPAAKPAAPAPAAAAEPAPIEPGEVGQQLQKAGVDLTPLGNDAGGMEMFSVPAEQVVKAAQFLRDKAGFDLLLSCAGVDWKDRLESVYHLYNTKTHAYVALKVTAVNEHHPSLTSVYPAADWHERESYDLLGIHYDGHPNLTRILMPVDWLGHPLRKDYTVNDPRLVWNER